MAWPASSIPNSYQSWWATDQKLLYTKSFQDYVDKELPKVKHRWNHPGVPEIEVKE